MTSIPLRQLNPKGQEPDLAESFSIRELGELMDGNDMLQALHRHDHYFILALEKGKGIHEIDFVPYKVVDHVVYFMRPGQVHQLRLKAGCKGYLLQFKADFFFIKIKTPVSTCAGWGIKTSTGPMKRNLKCCRHS
ncbi:MAG: AraC family ligand binding domain-containing protein [Bacteroidetes bacterium]|nr:AraC family ligand binding domain-containing protein [Bacteroidota bacterium]